MKCELVTFLSSSHLQTFLESYVGNLSLLGFDCITVVTSSDLENQIASLSMVHYINEEEILSYDALSKIRNYITLLDDNLGFRSFWYYQQFLKMAYSLKSIADYYVYI